MKDRIISSSFISEKKVNILIVDDEPEIRNILSEMIESILKNLNYEEYNIDVVSDGYKAIERVRKTFFSIIFLDINMGKINGIETLKQIKRTSPKTVVIMMTGGAQDNLLKEAMKENAYIILHKPFNSEVIADVVKKVLPTNPSCYPILQKIAESHNL